MFLGVLAIIALTAGTVQTATELKNADAVNLKSTETTVLQINETEGGNQITSVFLEP
jgi:hypothetical protein